MSKELSERFVLIAFEHFAAVKNRSAPEVLFRVVILSDCFNKVVRYYDSREKLESDIEGGLKPVDITYYETKGIAK